MDGAVRGNEGDRPRRSSRRRRGLFLCLLSLVVAAAVAEVAVAVRLDEALPWAGLAFSGMVFGTALVVLRVLSRESRRGDGRMRGSGS